MPTYFFHLTNGQRSTRFPDGLELPDLSASRDEALEMVAGLLREAAQTGYDWTGWRVEVYDAERCRVLTFPFSDIYGPGATLDPRGIDGSTT